LVDPGIPIFFKNPSSKMLNISNIQISD
jgi:hypothetical protein